jgi:SAM-dependent methyltransferase
VYQCEDCGFLQLNTVVDPEFHYRNFRYVTGLSLGLREHFSGLIDGLAAAGQIGPGKLVLDIGSNDGSLLAIVKEHGARVLGIDPAVEIAQEATKAGIPTIGDFFTSARAREMRAQHGAVDVVISNNTIANIENLDDLFFGIRIILNRTGQLIIETQYAIDILEKTLLDVIYHEHISYFSVEPMRRFLLEHGFELFDAERIAPKGGSIRFYAQHAGAGRPRSKGLDQLIAFETGPDGLHQKSTFVAFNARIASIGEKIRRRLERSRLETGRSLAYGSSVGCAALINYFDLAGLIDAIFDDNPLVNFVRSPRGNIPVLGGFQLANEPATDVLVLAWRYGHNIAARHSPFRVRGGRFYTALPDIANIDG